jgi:hypothetical protein
MSHSTSGPGPEVLWLISGEVMASVRRCPQDILVPGSGASDDAAQLHNIIFRLQFTQPQVVVRSTRERDQAAKGMQKEE